MLKLCQRWYLKWQYIITEIIKCIISDQTFLLYQIVEVKNLEQHGTFAKISSYKFSVN